MLLLAAARTCLSSPARPKSPPGMVPLLLRLPRSSHHRGGPTTSLPKPVRLLRPLGAAASLGASSRPARDRVIDFGRYKGQMLGTLPPSYLRWVVAELDYGDTAHWARLARDVLDDLVYLDRVEWEHAHRFLRGDANYDYAYDDGDSEDGPLQEMADRFGWDLSDEAGWGRLDFRLLGTSYGGRILRKGTGRQSSSNSSSPGGAKKGTLFDIGSDPDGPREKRNERRERRRLRREEQVRSAKMDVLRVNTGVKGDSALGTPRKALIRTTAKKDVLGLGMARDETTLQPSVYLNNLPSRFPKGCHILLVDPMLARGCSFLESLWLHPTISHFLSSSSGNNS